MVEGAETTYRPDSLWEALNFLEENDCKIVAGGTDIMVQYKGKRGTALSLDKPALFIEQLPELKKIYQVEGDLHIGACCTYKELLEHPLVPKILKDAIKDIAAPAIRNRGTIGGNICNASPAGDTLPLLYAYDAKVVSKSLKEEIVRPIATFIVSPRLTKLEENALVSEIIIPLDLEGGYTFFEKVGNRKADAIAKVSIGGRIEVKDGIIELASIAFGAVGPVVMKSTALEESLVGQRYPLEANVLEEIIEGYSKFLNPIDDQRSTALYRKTVALNLLRIYLQATID